MKICTIYHSVSGNTRGVAENVQAACGGKLVEVKTNAYSSRLTAYTLGCYRAMKGLSDPVEPAIIDVANDDLVVIGTPVWAGRATPVINGAVGALTGCSGKSAVIFATSGGKEGETLPKLTAALEEKGMKVIGEFAFDKAGIRDPGRINAMIYRIQTAGTTP
jgi:hypothetical protein